jgi:ribosomal-protein-serine acetyltransferase
VVEGCGCSCAPKRFVSCREERALSHRPEERIRTVVTERQQGRCADCGDEASTTPFDGRHFDRDWAKKLTPPRARSVLVYQSCAKKEWPPARSREALRGADSRRQTGSMLRYELPGGCYLRLFEESDAEELDRVIAANRDYLAEWLPWVETTSGADARREWIRRTRRQIADNDGFHAAIIEDDDIIGVLGFHAIDWNNRSTSIGNWLVEDRQGRGIMTEAVRTLTSHAFDVWDLNRVEIRVAVWNLRSAAIPQRLGFVEEGTLRQAERHGDTFKDVAVYSVLARDWDLEVRHEPRP